MPYCPKCDMEFIKGVTVCSDCGGSLFESKEEALAVRTHRSPANRTLCRRSTQKKMPPQKNPESFPGRKNRRVPPLPT